MNTLKFRVLDKKVYMSIVISLFGLIGIISFANLLEVVTAFNNWSMMAYVYLGVVVGAVLLIIFLKAKLRYEFIVSIDGSSIKVEYKGKTKKILLKDVVMVKRLFGVREEFISVYLVGKFEPIIDFGSADSTLINTLIRTLEQNQEYTIVQRDGKMGQRWTEYHNKDIVQSNELAFKIAKQIESRTKWKIVLACIGAFAALIAFAIIPFLINKKGRYEQREDKMYYSDIELVGVIPDSCRILDMNILIDSTHVYYKGRVLEGVDRPTFGSLDRLFYKDKNGIYYESQGWFSKHEIRPLEGDYDKATFKALGNATLFKDVNNLYHFKVSSSDKGTPLFKVKVKDLDVASFEVLNSNWAKDKNRVYFLSWEDVRPCTDIDVATFELVDNSVAKDSAHVYYLTRNVESDNARATEREDYAILAGADAPTFENIDYKMYQDKNTEWSIEEKGSSRAKRNTKVKDRTDL
ncbi:DKNYY domain-containing protein [Myroides sp. M-43]|uniref:DKNYY domain-containing protein n=1 Tax=Myroides oncorhynchi TaxID=2893756 RepID=UPI001E37673D|nr:DKNYY domain-containing protein [Myroides oncorhynchi]MCC9042487.1 DKNYY domain-containing protein [Myroides oncorhynchi]